MRIGVVGSRTFEPEAKVRQFIKTLPREWEIVSGGANGPDIWAETEARELNMPTNIHYAQWNLYGKRAGMIRNGLIVDDSDIIIAFYDGSSKGTRDTIKKAVMVKKPVITIQKEDDLPTVEEILLKINPNEMFPM